MKKLALRGFWGIQVVRLFIASILLGSTSFAVYAEAVQLSFDPKHSYLLWRIDHLGFSTQAGKWYVQGTLSFDKDNPANSKVKASIKLANIVTGIPELDKHLLGSLFFDAAKFPTATFVSDKVQVLSKTTAKVYGTLTLHGLSKPVVLDVNFNKMGKNPINDKETAGFSASTTIKRSDFGIKSLLPEIGDKVKIEINVEASKASQ